MKVLFVCRGNVGRSQMAEAIFNQLAAGRHTAFSCGTKVVDKDGQSQHGQKLKDLVPAREVINSLAALGIDATECARDQITPEILGQADEVVVVAEEYTIPDYLKAAKKVVYWEVEDPKGKDQAGTDEIREIIAGHVRNLIDELDEKKKSADGRSC